MILRFTLVILSLALLAHGGDGLYRALSSRTQAQVACEEFYRERPRSSWVRITGCELDYMRAGYREAPGDLWGRLFSQQPPNSRITELLFPVRPAGTRADTPAALVVSTRDPNVLAIAERTLGARETIDQEAFLVTMLQVVTAMRASREIEGTLRGPLDTLRSRRALSTIEAPLMPGFGVLDLNERPRIVLPAVETGTGLFALLLVSFRRRRAPAAAPPSESAAPLPPEVGTHAVVFPRLMLLNLGPNATLADLEKAPPLGSREAVRNRFIAVFPDVQFDDDGKARFARADYSIDVDLGSGDPVYTAVVDLRGNATDAFTRLLEHTGWRAFAPKRGTFVTGQDFEQSPQA